MPVGKRITYLRECFLCDPPNTSISNANKIICIIYEYRNDDFVQYQFSIYEKNKKRDL